MFYSLGAIAEHPTRGLLKGSQVGIGNISMEGK